MGGSFSRRNRNKNVILPKGTIGGTAIRVPSPAAVHDIIAKGHKTIITVSELRKRGVTSAHAESLGLPLTIVEGLKRAEMHVRR